MPEHEANDAPAGEIAQCFQGHAHAPGRAADGAARQQDRRDEVERHRRTPSACCCWRQLCCCQKLPIWLRERSVMVRADEGRAGCLAQGQGPIAS
jgi:hypothetical protein